MNIFHRVSFSLIACTGLMIINPMAQAASSSDGLSLGAAIANTPRYSGADSHHLKVLPIIHGKYKLLTLSTFNGIGIRLPLNDQLYFHQSIGYRSGRDESDSSHLNGMGDIDSAWTSRSELGVVFTPRLSSGISMTTAINHDQGFSYSPFIRGNLPLPNGFSASLEGKWLLGSEDFTQTFYGVNAQQSARTGYTRYKPAAGGYGHMINFNLTKVLGNKFVANVGVRYTYLSDKVARSAIVENRNNVTTMVGLTYKLF